MDAKLDNLSEISKLLSVKIKMSSDILSLCLNPAEQNLIRNPSA